MRSCTATWAVRSGWRAAQASRCGGRAARPPHPASSSVKRRRRRRAGAVSIRACNKAGHACRRGAGVDAPSHALMRRLQCPARLCPWRVATKGISASCAPNTLRVRQARVSAACSRARLQLPHAYCAHTPWAPAPSSHLSVATLMIWLPLRSATTRNAAAGGRNAAARHRPAWMAKLARMVVCVQACMQDKTACTVLRCQASHPHTQLTVVDELLLVLPRSVTSL
jgi:hypothetical protein